LETGGKGDGFLNGNHFYIPRRFGEIFLRCANYDTLRPLAILGNIFFTGFSSKTATFLNLPALGIGFAQAIATRLRIGMNQCAVQPQKPSYEEN
jgi:hypothetical protein